MRHAGTRNALLLAGVLSVAGVFSTTHASAAPPASASTSNKARASELFKKSADAYMKGDFAQAISLLDEAYRLDPQPVLIYNQARAHEGLGHTDEAIKLYEQYLTAEPSSPDRGAIEQRVATLKKQRDDKIAAEKERDAAQKELEQRPVEPPPPPPPPPHRRSVLPYVVAGVGVAGLAAGTVFGLMAKSKEDDGANARTQIDAIDARDTGSTFATVANVSFIAGGVLLAAGAVWWALDRPRKTGGLPLPATLRIGMGPSYVGAGGTF